MLAGDFDSVSHSIRSHFEHPDGGHISNAIHLNIAAMKPLVNGILLR